MKDGLREAREKFVRDLREEGDREGVDSALRFVGGEREGQPGGDAHREGLIELAGKGVDIGCRGPCGSGRIGDE